MYIYTCTFGPGGPSIGVPALNSKPTLSYHFFYFVGLMPMQFLGTRPSNQLASWHSANPADYAIHLAAIQSAAIQLAIVSMGANPL